MSFRPQLTQQPVITNGVMAGNITSLAQVIPKISLISFGFSWSGTSPTGTIAVQVSNDYSLTPAGQVLNAGTWTSVYFNHGGTVVNSISISGSTGNDFIDAIETAAFAIRAVYTASGGSGTLQAILNGKVL